VRRRCRSLSRIRDRGTPVLSKNWIHHVRATLTTRPPGNRSSASRPSAAVGERRRSPGSVQRLNQLIPNTLMISLRMIVRDKFRDGAPKVAFAKQERPVQTLPLDRSYKALRVRVAVGRARRRADDPDAFAFKERRDRAAPFGVPIGRSAPGRVSGCRPRHVCLVGGVFGQYAHHVLARKSAIWTRSNLPVQEDTAPQSSRVPPRKGRS